MTGALLDIDIRGRGGVTLQEKWAAGPRTYLGLAIAGFPNLFTITGPGSPSVLSNMIVSIEQHVDWIADCIAYLREHGIAAHRGRPRRPRTPGCAHVNEVGRRHALPAGQLLVHGRQHPRQAARLHALHRRRRHLPQKCTEVAARGYEGFSITAGEEPFPERL